METPSMLPGGELLGQLVSAGIGTESVRLGMSDAELIALLGKPNEASHYEGFCSYSHMHWFPPTNPDGSVDDGGIFAFLKDGRVFEIRFDEVYHTAVGIDKSSTLKDLKAKFAAPLFRLKHSANTATNHEDLFYIVETEKGIAYEIAVGYQTKKRALSAIYVFYPKTDFLPWGCITENQSFIEIPYS